MQEPVWQAETGFVLADLEKGFLFWAVLIFAGIAGTALQIFQEQRRKEDAPEKNPDVTSKKERIKERAENDRKKENQMNSGNAMKDADSPEPEKTKESSTGAHRFQKGVSCEI